MTIISTCKVANYWAVDELEFHPDNEELRSIDPSRWRALKKSILTQGFFEPILIWEKEGYIIAGNHRGKAAQELIAEGHEFDSPVGKNFLPIVKLDCDEKTAQGILLQTNTTYAEFVESALHGALREFKELGGDPEILGFSDIDVDAALNEAIKSGEELKEEVESSVGNIDEEPNRGTLTEEAYGSIVMPIDVHRQFVGILSEIAVRLNPSWRDGDQYSEAIQAMIEVWRSGNFTEEIEEEVNGPRHGG